MIKWIKQWFIERKQLKLVAKDPTQIINFDYISDRVALKALENDTFDHLFVNPQGIQTSSDISTQPTLIFPMIAHKVSNNVKLNVVKRHWPAIAYITNPSEQIQLAAINQDTRAALYITNPTDKVNRLFEKKRKHETSQQNS